MTAISIVFVVTLVILALATQIGVVVLERTFPAHGTPVAVHGAVLNVVDLGSREAATPPLLLLHGASCNLAVMQQPLGDMLAVSHRVILIDRPGHGHSPRERQMDSTPAIQARMVGEALDKLRIRQVIVVAHSWAGALATRMALDDPSRVAGLVLLAPVTHPWRGGVGWYNRVVVMPVIGPLLAYTITLPLGLVITESGARHVFLPEAMPEGFVKSTATPLLLRPREFLANARDLVTLKAAIAEQAPSYGKIRMPVTIISGDVDKTVSTNIHSRRVAATVAGAKLIVLPGTGHMIQHAVPDLVVSEIEAIIGRIEPWTGAAAK